MYVRTYVCMRGGRYEESHWFPTRQCPRHGPCWFDLFYAFSDRNQGDEQQITLAVGLTFCLIAGVAFVIVFVSSITPVFMRAQ